MYVYTDIMELFSGGWEEYGYEDEYRYAVLRTCDSTLTYQVKCSAKQNKLSVVLSRDLAMCKWLLTESVPCITPLT